MQSEVESSERSEKKNSDQKLKVEKSAEKTKSGQKLKVLRDL